MLLKEIVEKGHFLFAKEAPDWEESIRMSCAPLVTDGTVDEGYANEIIECVREHGPYIVLIPGFAMPHSTANSAGAHKTAISFMKLEKAVHFEEGNPEKDATVFFALAATDKDSHLKNMRALFKMLTDEELVAALLAVSSKEDLLKLDEKFS